MVIATLTVFAFLALWAYMDGKVRKYKDEAEFYEDCYYGMCSDNVDLRVQRDEAREAYCRIIGQNTMNWAAATATRN